MSTRACMAYIAPREDNPLGWRGVYQHYDGYPEGLGATIWQTLHKKYIGKSTPGISNDGKLSTAIKAFIDIEIKGHPAGWSSFPDTCYCHDPSFVMRDGMRESNITDLDNDPLFVEFVYVLDAEHTRMHIFRFSSVKDVAIEGGKVHDKPVNLGNGRWDYGHCVYEHRHLTTIDLNGPEPNWEELEQEPLED